MELFVASTKLRAETSTCFDTSGREHLIIVVKASWQIPAEGQRPRPIIPTPFSQGDEFYGEPGQSGMRYGSDFARFKPRCDILFDACAHAPNGDEVQELTVACQVGQFRKGVRVLGDRYWQKTLGVYSLSKPASFSSMPLHYGMAFGGTRSYQKGWGEGATELSEALLSNPAGRGWGGKRTGGTLDGQAAPNLEALGQRVSSPTGSYDPVALSAVARHWTPRTKYTGTYDKHWEEEICPFLPEDFDEQYHQCAPVDQQIAYPKGGEEVVLRNMLPGRGYVRFKLPRLDQMTIRVLRKDYSVETPTAVVDTLFFETEKQCFSAIWRASVPIRRRIQEFTVLAVGPINQAWWDRKRTGRDGCIGCGQEASEEMDEAA